MKYTPDNVYEIPDPTPIDVPLKFKRPESLDEKIRRILSTSVQKEFAKHGIETEEEANDFDIDDDPEVYFPTGSELAALTPQEMAQELGIQEFIEQPSTPTPSSGGGSETPPPEATRAPASSPDGGTAAS